MIDVIEVFAMRSRPVTIHNFRTVGGVTVRMQDYTLLGGVDNVSKSNVADTVCCFYGGLR